MYNLSNVFPDLTPMGSTEFFLHFFVFLKPQIPLQ